MAEQESIVQYKVQAYRVASQAPALGPDALEDARRIIGIEYRGARSTVQITKESIRGFCNSISCQNPLYLDETYATHTRWGGIIAPPGMVGQAIIGPGLRAIQWIYGGTEWEYFRVVRPGDTLTTTGRLVDAQEKRGRAVPRFIVQYGETTTLNQRGEVVCKTRVYLNRTARSQAESGMNYAPRLHRWTDAELAALEQEMEAEQIRGSRPRYWEDVEVGETVGPALWGPLRNTENLFEGGGAAGIGGGGGGITGAFVFQLLQRRNHPADTYLDPETGAQGHPHRGHYEDFMAREVGMPGKYDGGPHRVPWHIRLVTDWMGDDAVIKKVGAWLRRPNVVGDITRFSGKVAKKTIENGEHLVYIETQGINQAGEVSTPGYAVVQLQSRTVDPETLRQFEPRLGG